MVQALQEYNLTCPYCSGEISVLIDGSLNQQQYIEDCSVCCCPIYLDISIDIQGRVNINASSENEGF